MKKVWFYVFIAAAVCPGLAFAKDSVRTMDELNCSDDGLYCTQKSGRPFTGKLSRYDGGEKVLSNYQSGRLSGLTTVWNSEGKIVSKTYYKNNQKNGVERFYYDNRTIKSFAEYKDGYLHGRVDYYTPKGKLKGRLSYKNGYFEKGYCVVNGQKKEIKSARTTELLSCGD